MKFCITLMGMNRRNFIRRLVILPLIGIVPSIMASNKMIDPEDPFEIMNAQEIKIYGYKYIARPCFKENGTEYFARTYKLKIIHNDTPNMTSKSLYKLAWQQEVNREIRRLGLTHIHCVKFFEFCLVNPYGEKYYSAYVRGIKI